MRTLFIDLSAPTGLLACVDDAAVIASVTLDQRAGDAEVLEKTKSLLRETDMEMQDLGRIACITGPGGFTSLRVGVALANALAWGLKIPLAGIHGSDLWQARTGMTDGIWLQSTKKDLLFIRGFGSFNDRWPEPVTIALEALLSALALQPGTTFCGQLMPEHEQAVTAQGSKRCVEKPMTEAVQELLHNVTFASSPLEPWYGRGW